MGVGYRNVPPDQYNNDFGGEPGSLSNVMPLQQSVIRNIKQHAYSKDDKHCDKLTVRDMHRAVYSIAFAERVLHQESDDACSDDNRNSLCQHIDSLKYFIPHTTIKADTARCAMIINSS